MEIRTPSTNPEKGSIMYDSSVHLRIAELRAKGANGTLTKEEMKEAINLMREGRVMAQKASTTRKAAAAKPSGDDLLAQLGSL